MSVRLFFPVALLVLFGKGAASEAAFPVSALASPEVSEAVRRAEACEAAGDWRGAAFHWQRVLADGKETLHPTGPRRAVRACDLALSRLLDWPVDGKDAFEEMHGSKARDLAARFREMGDAKALRACVSDYPIARAAEGVLGEAASLHFEAGRVRAAAACLERIRRLDPAGFDRSARASLLAACRRALDRPAAVSAPAGLPRPGGFPPLRIPPLPCAAGDFSGRGIRPPCPRTVLFGKEMIWLLTAGETTAIDAATAVPRWTRRHPHPFPAVPWDPPGGCLTAGGLLVRPVPGGLAAFDARTGEPSWEIAEAAASRPASEGTSLFTVCAAQSDESGEVTTHALRIDASSGAILWRAPLSGVFRDHPARIGTLLPAPLLTPEGLVCADGLGVLAGVDPESGAVLWTSAYDPLDDAGFDAARARGARWKTPVLLRCGEAGVFASSETGGLWGLSLRDGRPLWNVLRGECEWVLGAHAGEIWLAGPRALARVSARDGAVRTEPLPEEAIGPGYLAVRDGKPCAVLPTRAGVAAVFPGAPPKALAPWGSDPPGFAEIVPSSPPIVSLWDRLSIGLPGEPAGEAALSVLSAEERAASGIERAARLFRAGRIDEAALAYDTLLDPSLRDALLRPRGVPVPVGEVATAALARLFPMDRLERLLKAPYAAAAAGARGAVHPRERLELYRRYPLLPGALDALREAGDLAAAAGNALLAEEAWTLLSAFPSFRGEATRRLAEAAEARGDFHAAAHFWKECLAVVTDGKEAIRAVLAAPPYAALREVSPPVDPVALLWHLKGTDGLEPIRGVWTGGDLFCAAEGKDLLRRDPRTGTELWRSGVGAPDAVFAVAGLLVAARGLEVARLDPESGRALWILAVPPSGGDTEGPPAPRYPERGPLAFREEAAGAPIQGAYPAGGSLVLQVDPLRCVGLSRDAGSFLWDRAWPSPARLLPFGDKLVALSGRSLHVVDPATGETLREADLPFPVSAARRLLSADRAWTHGGSKIALLDLAKGAALWTQQLDAGSCLAVRFDLREETAAVLLDAGPGKTALAGIDVSTGRLLWRRDVPWEGPLAWTFAQQDLLLAGFDGRHVVTQRVGARDGAEVWRFPLGLGRPLESPRILVSGRHAFLHDPGLPCVLWFDAATGERRQDLCAFGRGVLEAGFVAGITIVRGERGVTGYGRPAGPAFPPAADPSAGPGLGLDALPAGMLASFAEKGGDWHAAASLWREALDGKPESPLLRARMESAREVAFERAPPVLRARRFQRPPRIDGELSDGWAEENRLDLDGRDALVELPAGAARPWSGPEDLSARFYAGWDETFLYFALDVADQKGVLFDQEKGFSRGDSLLVHIDPEGDGGFAPAGGDRLVGLALQNPPAVPNRRDERPPGRYAVRPRPQGGGSVYEAAVPWSYLRRRGIPEGRPTLRISFQLADDDGEGTTRVLTLSPGMPLDRFAAPEAPLPGASDCPAPSLFAKLLLE